MSSLEKEMTTTVYYYIEYLAPSSASFPRVVSNMPDATFFPPKEMNYIENEHFDDCLVKKPRHGLWISKTVHAPA